MINLTLLREATDQVKKTILKKDPKFSFDALVELDIQVRDLMQSVEQLRSEKNELARSAQKGVSDDIRQRSIAIGKELKEKESDLVSVSESFKDLYLRCPNLLFDDIPVGNKEQNQVVKEFGQKHAVDFEIKNHFDVGKEKGWFDFEAAARMAASNFALYRGDAVRLLYALEMFMFKNNCDHGYEPVSPPYLVNAKALEGASNFPRFKDEVFAVEKDNLYLTPTSEVNLANLYRDAILSGDELPIRMTALSSCFRREAGGYGATERGLIRMHQFEKVELFSITTPEESAHEQERMLACAEDILQKLDLHYRVSLLAAQDCSFASAKTYDIEIWMPGQKEYKEVSSISNCTDFQSRRCAIRYRKQAGAKPELVHTLNGSSLALPRLMVAIIEAGQRADGSIEFPDALASVDIGLGSIKR
jgi:seryl-tRNA synthetase